MRYTAFVFLCLFCLLFSAAPATAEQREFTLFSVDMPAGWDGEERRGFKSESPEEYMLVLGLLDEKQENHVALVSIFVLPNEHADSSSSLAAKLAEFQADPSTPRQEGPFWSFSGTPRSQTFKAPAVTRVSTTPEKVLIAIVQDPEQRGAENIFSSLRGLTPQARLLLGQKPE